MDKNIIYVIIIILLISWFIIDRRNTRKINNAKNNVKNFPLFTYTVHHYDLLSEAFSTRIGDIVYTRIDSKYYMKGYGNFIPLSDMDLDYLETWYHVKIR